MHTRHDAPSGNATGTLLRLRSAPVVVQVSARCWAAGAAQVSALSLDWVVRRCIRISCAIDIVAINRSIRRRTRQVNGYDLDAQEAQTYSLYVCAPLLIRTLIYSQENCRRCLCRAHSFQAAMFLPSSRTESLKVVRLNSRSRCIAGSSFLVPYPSSAPFPAPRCS